jgi:tripartite-type tricarboxylate transporter receptor subunit TctC
MKKLLAAFGVTTAFALSLSGAMAQGERTITIVVPFAAGGPTDTVTRLVAESMSRISASRSSSKTSAARAARSARPRRQADPDGYTLLLHHIGMATSATLYRKLPYDTLNAFEYVGLVTEVPMTIVGKKDLEPADLKALSNTPRPTRTR